MRTLILIVGCLLLCVPSQAAEKESDQNLQQFEEIDKYISRQRRCIEHYYTSQLVELNQRAESEIRLLEVADKALYAGTGGSAYANFAAQGDVAKTVLHIDDFGYRAPWYLWDETERKMRLKDKYESCCDFKDSFKNSPERFAVAHSLITERKNYILANLEWEALKLERQRQYALTTGLEQLQKRMEENVLKSEPEEAMGLVTGILYSADKPSVIVDRKILHEWDTMHGVTVVKIDKNKVKFQKDGKRWEQKVQEAPAANWK